MYQEYLIVLLSVSVVMTLLLLAKLRKTKTALYWAELDKRMLEDTIAADLSAYLENVTKDIATELIERNSGLYIGNLSELQSELSELEVSDQKNNSDLLEELIAKYPKYINFDECRGSWPHILRSESFDCCSDNELIELFNDIRRFSVLKSKLDEHWRHDALVGDLEIENAKKFARRLEDTVLLRQLKFVEKIYYPIIYGAESSDTDSEWLVATEAFKVKIIWPDGYEPETCYGVYFPQSNLYGSFTLFYDEKRHVSFYRSDASFSELESLHTLRRYGDFSNTLTFIKD